MDLGIIHPYAVVTEDAGLLASGRAVRAESYLHLKDQQARQVEQPAASRPGSAGRAAGVAIGGPSGGPRPATAAVYQPTSPGCPPGHRLRDCPPGGNLVVGDPTGITGRDAGRVQNWRPRQWRRTHLLGALRDKPSADPSALGGGARTSSTCPACRQRVPKPRGRWFSCPHCRFQGHRDLVGATNIAAKLGGGHPSDGLRRAGRAPSGRDGAGLA